MDTDKTIKLIKEKEQVLTKEESELNTQNKNLVVLDSKIESINLELKENRRVSKNHSTKNCMKNYMNYFKKR